MKHNPINQSSLPHHFAQYLCAKPPLSDEVKVALSQGPQSPELALELAVAADLMKPGYLPLENGYARLANGQLFVAVRTAMTEIRGDMLDFWFSWHYHDPARYKLWNPADHLDIYAKPSKQLTRAHEAAHSYLGITTTVTEIIGSKPLKLDITFIDPTIYGFNPNQWAASAILGVVCARISHAYLPLHLGHLIHVLREHNGQNELRSRFWLGDFGLKWRGYQHSARLPRLVRKCTQHFIPLTIAPDLLTHCATEMSYLRDLLPTLYARYGKEINAINNDGCA